MTVLLNIKQNSFNSAKNNTVKNTTELPKEKILNDSILSVTNKINGSRQKLLADIKNCIYFY